MTVRPAVLVIAATDSSGGAGLTRDVQVLADFEVDVLCAVTVVTAQSDSRVAAVHHVPAGDVRAQIAAACKTRDVGAVKIGMLGTREIIAAVAHSLPARESVPIVLDPVLSASCGGALLDLGGRRALREQLIPCVTLITPNIPEAAALLGEGPEYQEPALIEQAQRLLALGPLAVLLKGGHATGDEAVDLLVSEGSSPVRISSPRLEANRRGTGCALASAIAAGLASGMPLTEACRRAKHYLAEHYLIEPMQRP